MAKPIEAKESFVDLRFPAKGIDLSQAFGQQQPGTTPLGQNVRAFEPSTARARGGQRPGLLKYLPGQVNGTGAIQDLNVVVGVGYVPPGSTGIGQVSVLQTKAIAATVGTSSSGTFNSPVTVGSTIAVLVYGFDTDSNITVAASSVGDSQGDAYLKAVGTGGPGTGVNPGGGVQRSGTQSSIWYFSGVAAGTLTVTVNYGATNPGGFLLVEMAGPCVLDVTSSKASSGAPATTGPVTTTQAGAIALTVLQAFTGVNESQNVTALGAGWTGLLNVTASRPTDIEYQIFSTIQAGLNPTWTTFSSTDQGYSACIAVFKAAASSGQTSQSGRIVSLVGVSGGVVKVAQAGSTIWAGVANTTGKSLISSGVIRSASNNQKLWFADGTSYLYYDPSDNAMHVWTASAGTLPASGLKNTPRLIKTWRGRTVVSGITTDPQNWFMSAVADPTNWNYFPLPITPTQAVAGNNSTLGIVGDIITCLIPYTDDVLIFGGDHTIWMMQGDPMAGGQIMLVSNTIGMAWGDPWCMGPDGTIYFFSNKMGIYQFNPSSGTPPTRMSQQIEQLLSGLDTGSNIIRMQWDDLLQGFHTYITPASGATATTHFFWEMRTGAWWTDVFDNNNQNPLCCVTFDGNLTSDRRALIGSWDGYVRTMSSASGTDDGTPVASAVVLGPLLTKDMDAVLLKDMQALLGTGSGPVTFAVYLGATAEAALASVPIVQGTWQPGRNLSTYIRRTAHAVWVKITATAPWSMEAIRARVAGQGKIQRRGY